MVSEKKQLTCAIYTRKSSDEGLEQEFNSLHAQREACEAFILSQRHEGWKVLENQYDDGGFSGGNMERPALKRLLQDIRSGKVDVIVVYKVDRLTRSLSDFAKIVDVLDGQGVSFVSVTQQFNTTSSMGRLTLNVLLSFAQFEREVTGERIRDKIAASKRKGMWMGGPTPIGYDLKERRLVINEIEAEAVRTIYRLYIECGSVPKLQAELQHREIFTKVYTYKTGQTVGGKPFFRGHLYELLSNRLYLGETVHKGQCYPGQHSAIIDMELWDQVQVLTAKNAVNRKFAVGTKYPSLAAGFIYDDRGNRLSPSHTVRGSVVSRYYVCQAILQNQPEKVGPIRSVPAREIESLIKNECDQLLARGIDLSDQLLGTEADMDKKHQLLVAAKALRQTLADDENNWLPLIRTIVSKVVIGPEHVDITFDKAVLLQKLEVPAETPEENRFQITVPARLTRSGRRRRLIITGHSGQPEEVRDELIKTLARAFKWEEQVRSGSTMQKIAKAENLSGGYVARVVRAAFLAPDIVKSIMDGRQPPGLKTKRLLRALPMDWAEQRRVLGFPAR